VKDVIKDFTEDQKSPEIIVNLVNATITLTLKTKDLATL